MRPLLLPCPQLHPAFPGQILHFWGRYESTGDKDNPGGRAIASCEESHILLDPLNLFIPGYRSCHTMFRRAGRLVPLQSDSAKALLSAKGHSGKERMALLCMAPMEDGAAEQQPQLPSELYKTLAHRSVYKELRNKLDFKIAQSPVMAQWVTFFFHVCLLPCQSLLSAQQLSLHGLQTCQRFCTREAGGGLCLRSWRNML